MVFLSAVVVHDPLAFQMRYRPIDLPGEEWVVGHNVVEFLPRQLCSRDTTADYRRHIFNRGACWIRRRPSEQIVETWQAHLPCNRLFSSNLELFAQMMLPES